jgi:hypothetical protein
MRAATFTRQLTAAALVAGVTTTTVLVAPGTARAVPGLQLEVEMSNVNSSTTKTVTAMCPAGTTVVGGGGYAGNGGEDVFVTGLEPVRIEVVVAKLATVAGGERRVPGP